MSDAVLGCLYGLKKQPQLVLASVLHAASYPAARVRLLDALIATLPVN